MKINIKQEATWLMAQLKEYVSAVLLRCDDLILLGLESVCLDSAVLYFNYFSQCCNGVTLYMLYRHGLYICIILETVHYRTILEYFATLLKRQYLKKIVAKYSILLH